MHLTLGSFDSCRLVWRSRRSQRRLRLQLHLLPVGNDSNSRIRRTSPDWFFGSTALRFSGSMGLWVRLSGIHPANHPLTELEPQPTSVETGQFVGCHGATLQLPPPPLDSSLFTWLLYTHSSEPTDRSCPRR